MSDLKLWLQSLGLEKYGEVLANHDVDLNVVSDLSDQDLQELGLSLGHRRKFMAAAAKLRWVPTSQQDTAAQMAPAGQASPLVDRETRSNGHGRRRLIPDELTSVAMVPLHEYSIAASTVRKHCLQ